MSAPIKFIGKYVFESAKVLKTAFEVLDSELLFEEDFTIVANETGVTATLEWDGSGPYEFYEDTTPQLEMLAEFAIGGSVCCWLDNSEDIWVPATKPLGYSPAFDVVLRDVIGEDEQGVEFSRNDYLPAFATEAVSAYHSFGNWMQKALLIQLVQDGLDPALRPIMVDFLKAPLRSDYDTIWLSKAIALSHLAGNHDLFVELLNLGPEEVEIKAAAFLVENN